MLPNRGHHLRERGGGRGGGGEERGGRGGESGDGRVGRSPRSGGGGRGAEGAGTTTSEHTLTASIARSAAACPWHGRPNLPSRVWSTPGLLHGLAQASLGRTCRFTVNFIASTARWGGGLCIGHRLLEPDHRPIGIRRNRERLTRSLEPEFTQSRGDFFEGGGRRGGGEGGGHSSSTANVSGALTRRRLSAATLGRTRERSRSRRSFRRESSVGGEGGGGGRGGGGGGGGVWRLASDDLWGRRAALSCSIQ